MGSGREGLAAPGRAQCRGIIGLDSMNVSSDVHILPASTPEHYETARVLFLEYAAQLGIDL